ncbi:PAP2 superfamily protein [Prevotellaceae bacterium MN60]|nr:PAP2 superfamily protein [Prevotellaceae bacterium MN60]
MNTRHYFTLVVVALSLQVNANNYRDIEPLVLEVPEMKAELVRLPEQSLISMGMEAPMTTPKLDFDFFKSKTNQGVKPYKFMDDLTFVGVPLFLAGWGIKGDKALFRVNQKAEKGGKKNTQLLTDFKTGIDDYTQFFGPAVVVGLKLGGYEGRSDWPRLLASAGMSYAIMAGFVNGIKYTAKEMRPDGSTANSWPSGHTATSFVGATLLHKEYGLTRSPWWSVAGYGVATATGVMRVLNNRHWISDVLSGAGIGIMSTELGYALCDLMFKGRGLLRNDMVIDKEKPSFFSISMGVGLGNKDLEFDASGEKVSLKFRAATVVDAEGAYFFNKYVGVGGRLRVRAQSVKDFGDFANYVAVEDYYAWEAMQPHYEAAFPGDYTGTPAENMSIYLNKIGYRTDSESAWNNNAPVTDSYGIVKSDHITEFTGSIGVYFNLPLGSSFSLGAKALIGRSITQELDIDGHAEGNVKDISYTMSLDNRPGHKETNGDPSLSLNDLQYPNNTGEKWSDEWAYLTVGAKSSTSFGTGISLTYRYKSNFSWRVFCDYDYTRKDFTATYDPFHFVERSMTSGASYLIDLAQMAWTGEYADGLGVVAREYKSRKYMNYWTLGLSFLVNF